jgi:hypothetical protein
MAKTLWILTEERPKTEVVGLILEKFLREQKIAAFIDTLRIIPVLDKSSLFTSLYKVVGLTSPAIDNIYLRIVSGRSSFVDYLVYFQDKQPAPADRPLYAIEETKTDDSESRNTGVFQRATKFVYLDIFYPGIDKTMLYNLKIAQKAAPTQTNVFGTRCFRTLGVQFIGKTDSDDSLDPWGSVDELIQYKAGMQRPPAGNVPILITKISDDLITVSGRLVKAGSLAHDPNIGALSLISATLRKLGWTTRIQIVSHGLLTRMVTPSNKFIQIANHLSLEIEGIPVPAAKFPDEYWLYESTGEKLGTIFVHLMIEEFSKGYSIYENHAGCERGYFYTAEGTPLAVGKRLSDEDGVMAKDAEKISIPDLIVVDLERLEIINIEGERSVNVLQGIKQLETFENIERTYLARHWPGYKVLRTVVLYGGHGDKIEHVEVSFLLNAQGKIVLGVKAPVVFRESLKNLVDFWKAGP